MNKMTKAKQIAVRVPDNAESYQDILDRDTVPPAPGLRKEDAPDIGLDPVPTSVYTSQEHFDLEAKHMWLKVWQMACREEEIPNVGDHLVYEIVGRSLIIVRTAPDKIQAFQNVCLHRGRRLVDQAGCKNEFRCPFHGFTWNIDGTFKSHPFPWDFPQIKDEDLSLPEAQVGRWGGFVFVNFDKDAVPLEEWLDPLPEHFAPWRPEERYIALHVGKVVKANWKVVSEAFMESHHTVDTHPQIMPYLADSNSQYDIFSKYITRQVSAMCEPSPHLDEGIEPQDVINAMLGTGGNRSGMQNSAVPQVPEGKTARHFAGDLFRQMLTAEDKHDYSNYGEADLLDAILYNVFPNVSIWGGIAPSLLYRWRPVANKPDETLMEVYRLKLVPKEGPRPDPAPMKLLTGDQRWTDAEELGPLAGIFEQDESNLPYVQIGLNANPDGVVHFSRYQEMRIRHHHHLIQEMINIGEKAEAKAAKAKTKKS